MSTSAPNIYNGELMGKVIRTAFDELLWVVGFEDDPSLWPDGGPGPEYVALCLSGTDTGKTRRMSPAAVDDFCDVIEANYASPERLHDALLEGLVAI